MSGGKWLRSWSRRSITRQNCAQTYSRAWHHPHHLLDLSLDKLGHNHTFSDEHKLAAKKNIKSKNFHYNKNEKKKKKKNS